MNINLNDEMVEVLDHLIDKHLKEKEAFILRAHSGMNGEALTFAKIGEMFGISACRVRMYNVRAINRLRRVIFYSNLLRDTFLVHGDVYISDREHRRGSDKHDEIFAFSIEDFTNKHSYRDYLRATGIKITVKSMEAFTIKVDYNKGKL